MLSCRNTVMAVIVGVAWCSPALADENARQADIRCFALTSYIVGTASDAEIKQSATYASLYFAGKLAAQGRQDTLEDDIVKTLSGAKESEVQAELNRCQTELNDAGNRLKTIGDAIIDRSGGTNPDAPAPPKP